MSQNHIYIHLTTFSIFECEMSRYLLAVINVQLIPFTAYFSINYNLLNGNLKNIKSVT